MVVVVDVGARWGAAERWRSLGSDLRVIGFDPDAEECARLNDLAQQRGDEASTYVPVALGPRRQKSPLYLTKHPACSSIYPPVSALIDHYPALADIAVEQEVTVELVSLDEWCDENGVESVDVLKLDTQGSELGILQGAVQRLATCLLIESEVEFNPLYVGQPLFGDVDAFLRTQGFVLWRIDNLMHYTDDHVLPRLDGSVTVNSDSRATSVRIGGGQLFWADAFWVRGDLLEPGLDEETRTLAFRVARAAGFSDLAARLDPTEAPELLAEARNARKARRKARRAALEAQEVPQPSPPRRRAGAARR